MAFRHGNCIEHYNYGDQGSFMLFAKGAPLVLHFGSVYTPNFQGAWYFNNNHLLGECGVCIFGSNSLARRAVGGGTGDLSQYCSARRLLPA